MVRTVHADRAVRTVAARVAAPLVYAAVAALLAAAVWYGGMERLGFYQDGQIIDTPVYLGYADAVAAGHLPYRDVAVEYPPLAFAAFLPPRAVTSSPDRYRIAFADEMGLYACALAAVSVLAAASAGHSRLRWAAAGLLGALGPAVAGPIALSRYDLWPTLLVALALWAAAARRDGLAGAALGLGVAAKLWPLLAAPPLLALAWRRGGVVRALAGLAVGAGVPLVVTLAAAPHGLAHALRAQLERPLQIESTAGAALIGLTEHGVGTSLHVVTSHGSQNLTGGAAGGVSTALPVVLGFALAWCWLEAWRTPAPRARDDAFRLAFASVVAALAFGRVLSPQFVLWLLPFPLLVRGRRGWASLALVVLALSLTWAEFPHRYWDYVGFDGQATAIVLTRDLVLVALFVLLALPARALRRSGETA